MTVVLHLNVAVWIALERYCHIALKFVCCIELECDRCIVLVRNCYITLEKLRKKNFVLYWNETGCLHWNVTVVLH